jgi:hypothetical protein
MLRFPWFASSKIISLMLMIFLDEWHYFSLCNSNFSLIQCMRTNCDLLITILISHLSLLNDSSLTWFFLLSICWPITKNIWLTCKPFLLFFYLQFRRQNTFEQPKVEKLPLQRELQSVRQTIRHKVQIVGRVSVCSSRSRETKGFGVRRSFVYWRGS